MEAVETKTPNCLEKRYEVYGIILGGVINPFKEGTSWE